MAIGLDAIWIDAEHPSAEPTAGVHWEEPRCCYGYVENYYRRAA